MDPHRNTLRTSWDHSCALPFPPALCAPHFPFGLSLLLFSPSRDSLFRSSPSFFLFRPSSDSLSSPIPSALPRHLLRRLLPLLQFHFPSSPSFSPSSSLFFPFNSCRKHSCVKDFSYSLTDARRAPPTRLHWGSSSCFFFIDDSFEVVRSLF